MAASSQSYGAGSSAGASSSAAPPASGWSGQDADERQALLLRHHTPCVEKCLFALSGRNLWDILWLLFLHQLYCTDKLQEWGDSVVVTLFADICYALLLVIMLLLSMVGFLNLRFESFCGTGVQVFWVYITATTAWWAMLQISKIHQGTVTCWACADPEEEMHLDGLNNFVRCWRFAPIGLLRSFVALFWRPWWFFFQVLPKAVVGKGPLVDPGGLPWWQCREIIIGTVVQPCAVMLGYTGRTIEQDWRWVLVLSVALTFLIAAVPFYLTTTPFVMFWAFLWQPWQSLFEHFAKGQELNLRVEEWLAAFFMTWHIVRVIYIVASMRLEEWNARKSMEEGLRYALEHPFQAQLEHNFGEAALSAVDVEQGQGVLRRTLSQITGGVASSNPEHIGSLKEKRKTLQDLGRDSRGNVATMPSRLALSVRRSELLEDTFKTLLEKPVTELLAPSMLVRFEDELGADAGGLTRDWFDSVAKALMEGADDVKGGSLLALLPDQTLVPRQVVPHGCELLAKDKDKFRSLLAVGRFLALAVYRDQPLPLSFSLVACKHLLGVPVGFQDVQRLDPEFYRGRVLSVLKEGGLQELEAALGEPLVFTSAPTELRPHPEELKENGAMLIVTEENKTEYVQLLCEAHLCGGIRREIQCLLTGFWDVLPRPLLVKCQVTPRELSLLISGIRSLDPSEWRRNSVGQITASGSPSAAKVIDWFWEIVQEFDEEQRCMLLHFATGSSRLPPTGFADLHPKFTVCVHSGGAPDRLPVAHTCSNQVDLQDYATKEQLRDKLKLAIYTETFELV